MHMRCTRRYCKSTCTIDLVCFKHFISKNDIGRIYGSTPAPVKKGARYIKGKYLVESCQMEERDGLLLTGPSSRDHL